MWFTFVTVYRARPIETTAATEASRFSCRTTFKLQTRSSIGARSLQSFTQFAKEGQRSTHGGANVTSIVASAGDCRTRRYQRCIYGHPSHTNGRQCWLLGTRWPRENSIDTRRRAVQTGSDSFGKRSGRFGVVGWRFAWRSNKSTDPCQYGRCGRYGASVEQSKVSLAWTRSDKTIFEYKFMWFILAIETVKRWPSWKWGFRRCKMHCGIFYRTKWKKWCAKKSFWKMNQIGWSRH